MPAALRRQEGRNRGPQQRAAAERAAASPLSAPSIARPKAGWQAEYEVGKTRSVADPEVVYLWVDGIYVKAGLEKDKAAILVVLAALRDGRTWPTRWR